MKTFDAHPAANIFFANVEIGANAVLGSVDGGYDVLEAVLDCTRLGLAAEMLGDAGAAFEMTGEYLKSSQAVWPAHRPAHRIAQPLQHCAAIMFTELALTCSCVAAALDALDRNANMSPNSPRSQARVGETLHLVSKETVQMHGGIGMTDAHKSGHYMKRLRPRSPLWRRILPPRPLYAAAGTLIVDA